MLISVSQIKEHMTCPMLAHYRYNLRRVPHKVYVARELGTLVHMALESLLLGNEDFEPLVEKHIADTRPLISEEWDSVEKEWSVVAEILREWKVPADWEIVAVEKELEIPCGRHTIVGRLDTVVKWEDLYWHVQHKSLAAGTPVDVFAAQQRTDWHESVYQRMAEAAGYQPFMGTMLNVIRKFSRKMLNERGAAAAITRLPLPRSDELVDAAFADLAQLIDDVEAGAKGERRIIMNRTACGGKFGNSLCPYKGVCDGHSDINDDADFRTVEPRYGPADGTE